MKLTLTCALLFTLLLSIQSIAGENTEWELIWADEFETDGLPNPDYWSYAVGGHGWGNAELQYYTDGRIENASVESGMLTITARKEAYEGNDYTSTRLITRGKVDMFYGRIEVRAKIPGARGTWPAIWMMPADWEFSKGGWPDVGEIDIMEHVGHDPGIIHASAHSKDYQWQKGTQKTGTIEVPTATESFHTYALEWSPGALRAFVDDELFFKYENEGLGVDKWPYNKPFYLILNIAVGGEWGSVKGIDADAFPQEFHIDYVRYFKAK